MPLHISPRGAALVTTLALASCGDALQVACAQQVPPAAEGNSPEQAPARRELYESGRIQFSAPPPTVVAAGVECDLNGNLYLVYGGSFQAMYTLLRSGASPPVSKVSLGSRSVVQFPVGQFQDFAEYNRHSFYVDPRGKMYGLIAAYKHERGYKGPDWPESLIVKYKDDGTVDSLVKLESPPGEHFEAWNFGVFLDGNFLVTGTTLDDKHKPTEPLTGIFDRGGVFIGPLTLPHDVRPRRPQPTQEATRSSEPSEAGTATSAKQGHGEGETELSWLLSIQQGLLVGSPDGKIYLLRATAPARLYAISSLGTVQAEMELKPPQADMQPIQMSLAGENGLFLKFAYTRSQKQPPFRETLALFDVNSGRITETFDLPPDATGLISGCATPRNELLFLGTTKDKQLEVVKFAVR